MPIRFACEKCQCDYEVSARDAGRRLKCKFCGATIQVPVNRGAADYDDLESLGPDDRDELGSAVGRTAIVIGILVLLGGAGLGLLLLSLPGGGPRPLAPPAALPDVAPLAPHLAGEQAFQVSGVPIPTFPELAAGSPHPALPGASVHNIDLGTLPENGAIVAGFHGQLRLYLPPGEHAPRSLGCVLVAPAGTNLLCGNRLDDGDYFAETLPYVQAGYAVVEYSLDGALPVEMDQANDAQMSLGYAEFRAAHAGLVNARNALEFVVARVPQVDPTRIFSAGHSSAGTLSLLFAEHEPRLKGCLAYAPGVDIVPRMAELTGDPGARILLPGVVEFVRQSSPMTYAARLKSPVFLFHAADDENTPLQDTARLAAILTAARRPVTFLTAARGGHYQSMVDEGVPKGIAWMQRLPGE